MPTDPQNPPKTSESEQHTHRAFEEAIRQLEAHREKVRELVKEMDQEVADAEQRRSDREGNDKG
jgi:hypothetical protein